MQSIDLNKLTEVLKIDPAVHAAWLEGSMAEGAHDEFSDMDIWIDVDDGREDEVFEHIENFLTKTGELDIDYAAGINHPLLRHNAYHIAGASPFERLEVNMQSHSRNFKFVEGVHKIKVLFDKDSTIMTIPLDKENLKKELKSRKRFLLEKIEFGELWVEKEIKRQKFPEALLMFQHFLVESIVELARIKYSPLKISFGLKHMSRDLPADWVSTLESFYKVQNLEEMRTKAQEIKVLAQKLK